MLEQRVTQLEFTTPGRGLLEITAPVPLWEHRTRGHRRQLALHLLGEVMDRP